MQAENNSSETSQIILRTYNEDLTITVKNVALAWKTRLITSVIALYSSMILSKRINIDIFVHLSI